jgi:hypothetical protein
MLIGKKGFLDAGFIFAPYIMVDKIDDNGLKDTSKLIQTVASRYATIELIQRIDKIKKILKNIEDLKNSKEKD